MLNVSATVIFLVIVYNSLLSGANFVSEPQDFVAVVGDTVTMRCVYHGSRSYPSWSINYIVYNWYSLPEKHTYSLEQSTLMIEDVDLSMNNSRYQCLFPNARSRIASLYVMFPTSSSTKTSLVTLDYQPTPKVVTSYYKTVIKVTTAFKSHATLNTTMSPHTPHIDEGSAVRLAFGTLTLCLIIIILTTLAIIVLVGPVIFLIQRKTSPGVDMVENDAYEIIAQTQTYIVNKNPAYEDVKPIYADNGLKSLLD